MTERLWERWRAAVSLAREPAHDPAELAERSGWAVVLQAFEMLDDAEPDDRQVVRKAVGVALPKLEDDALKAVGQAVLGAFAGKRPSVSDLVRPSAQRLVRLLRGELDGVAAAHCAGWLANHPDEAHLLRVMAEAEGAPRPQRIAVAAASASQMRNPNEGKLIAALEDPPIEAVLFTSPRQLAIYAAEPVAVRLEAEGVTTEEIAPGYWIGKVSGGASQIEAVVHIGDRELRWTLELA